MTDEQGDAHTRVSVVAVTYNSTDVLPGMPNSLPAGTRTILVDNNSADIAGLTDLANRHQAEMLRQSENLGFGAACNAGAALSEADFLLLLNPDARLMPDTLHQLVAAAEARPDASAFNPLIRNSDGSPANKRFTYLITKRRKLGRSWPKTDTEVPFLTGSALFVRRAAFEKIGGFDPKIFPDSEDDDLSLRLKREGGPLMMAAWAMVAHSDGGQVSAIKTWFFVRSRIHAMRKHGRPFPFAKVLFSAIRQLLTPRVLTSPDIRAGKLYQLRAVLGTWRDGGAGIGKVGAAVRAAPASARAVSGLPIT